MKEEFSEKDALWSLLGKARPVRPSPFFARNILREIRTPRSAPLLPEGLLRWFSAAAFCLVLLGFTLTLSENSARLARTPPTPPPLQGELLEVFDRAAGLPQIADLEEFTLVHFAGL